MKSPVEDAIAALRAIDPHRKTAMADAVEPVVRFLYEISPEVAAAFEVTRTLARRHLLAHYATELPDPGGHRR